MPSYIKNLAKHKTKSIMVKIVRQGERFWVHLLQLKGNKCFGIVKNDLIVYKKKFGDKIFFDVSEIITIDLHTTKK